MDITASAKVDFNFILPDDVLIELLGFGRRRQLAALELIGRRFYGIIDVGLSSAPFIYIKHLACPIEVHTKNFDKMVKQNKLRLHDVEDEKDKVKFLSNFQVFFYSKLQRYYMQLIREQKFFKPYLPEYQYKSYKELFKN